MATVDLTGDSSEDEELRQAIQLSLQPAEEVPNKRNRHSEDREEDDEEQLKRAIQLSLETGNNVKDSSARSITLQNGSIVDSSTVNGDIRSLKRKVSQESSDTSKKLRLMEHPADAPEPTRSDHANVMSSVSMASEQPVFPNGIVKRTWSYGRPREDDLKIEEVLQSRILKRAVLSSFIWDGDWLFSKVDCKRTKVTLVMDENNGPALEFYNKYKYISICGPKDVVGIMHSKLMLLFYDKYMRIVVPTANLVPSDWGENGVMENMVFLIDLPYLVESVPRLSSNSIEGQLFRFREGLCTFCRQMSLKQEILEQISQCDFSVTKNFAFIFSAGKVIECPKSGEDLDYIGLGGLGKQVKELDLGQEEIQIDFVASSIGQLHVNFLSQLYLACQGNESRALVEFSKRPKQPKRAVSKGQQVLFSEASTPPQEDRIVVSPENIQEVIKRDIRIYFPSHNSVARSIGGLDAGGTICLQEKFWNNPKFPQDLFYDCRNVRQGLLMHNKVSMAILWDVSLPCSISMMTG